MHREPLAVSRTNVDVHGAEVVVLLVARRAAPGNLHVELDSVHAQDGVSYVAEQIASRHHPGERRQLTQLLQL